ncbi:rho GTPase-activating protein 24-like [Glandiceps talaboti]
MNLGPTLEPEVIHHGWLKKQGGMVKNWQKRWFVLVGDELKYFTKDDENKQMGTIYLIGKRVTVHPYNADEPNKYLLEILPGEGEHKITSNHDSYILWATTQPERDEWVRMIRRVMYRHIGGGVFGQSLIDIITSESTGTSSTKKIPTIVEQCVSFIRENGLQEEGIFRLAGRAALVKKLQEQFDTGQKPDFKALNVDVHSVASLLKLYLRSLPEPVIPLDNYPMILDTLRKLHKNEAGGREEMIRQLAYLPRVNHSLLKFLSEFLHDVQKYESQNKMGLRNLATVFGPNIFRAKEEDSKALMENANLSHQLMLLLIEDWQGMFPDNDQINFSTCAKESPKEPQSELMKVRVLPERPQPPKPPSVSKIDLLTADDFLTSDTLPAVNNSDILQPIVSKPPGAVVGELIPLDDSGPSVSIPPPDVTSPVIAGFDVNGDIAKKTDEEPVAPKKRTTPLVPSRPAPIPPVRPTQPPKIPNRPTDNTPIDLTLSYSFLQTQVQALKAEMIKQKEEYEAKLMKQQKDFDKLHIMLKNEAKGRVQAEERNQQLLKDLDLFCKKYDT